MRYTWSLMRFTLIAIFCLFILTGKVMAEEIAHKDAGPVAAANNSAHADTFDKDLGWLALALVSYSVLSAAAARFKQPKVMGGLIGGVLVAIGSVAFPGLRQSGHGFIAHLAEIGAMLLLFMAGLEANLNTVVRDAKIGWKVATIGVVMPLIGAFLYTLAVKGTTWQVALFQGGIFTATSVGITVAVLSELGVVQKDYAKAVISAAVIDDIMGLVVLAVCQACNTPGEVSLSSVAGKVGIAVLFVAVIPILGHVFAKRIIHGLYRVSPESQEAIILAWMTLYGAAAIVFGLAPIVGAYFAGVAIEEAYFEENPGEPNPHHKPIEHYLKGLVGGFGPVFFVYAGSIIDPRVFLNGSVLFTGLMFTAIAIVGKLAAGLVMPRGNRLIVGVGMIPRGEVGIIFATMGVQSGIINQELFGASMIMVMLSTLVTPPLLGKVIAQLPASPPAPDASAQPAPTDRAPIPLPSVALLPSNVSQLP